MMSFLCGGKGRESGHNWQLAIVASGAMKSGKNKGPRKIRSLLFPTKTNYKKNLY